MDVSTKFRECGEMINFKFIIIGGFIVLSGCVMMQPRIAHLNTTLDVNEMEKALSPGNNKIIGSALFRQNGGGVVSCAGDQISLDPVMDYSSERIKDIYGSDQSGYLLIGMPQVKFQPDNPEYSKLTRVTTCDAQGTFEFDSVKDGEYYLTTAITWMAGYSPQGGLLMQRVKVIGGETKRVVLSP